MKTPAYIKGLLKGNGERPRQRRVWSIELEGVWLPFFTATNAQGDTSIASDALGAPLRLALAKDGSVKFSTSGRPVIKVAKDIGDAVRLVRDNFVAGLMAYTHNVFNENPEGYKAQISAAKRAGAPILERDHTTLTNYLALLEAMASVKVEQEPEVEQEQEPVLVA